MRKYLLIILCGFNINCLAQNIGIGTTLPDAPLHIKGVATHILKIEGNKPYLSLFDIADGERGFFGYNGNSLDIGTLAQSKLPVSISPNAIVSTTFLANGNVGIGNTNPLQRLQVAGNIEAAGTLKGIEFTYTAPKTFYYSLCGSDILQKHNSDQVERENTSGGGVYILGGSGSLTAPLHLPHGATVTRMTVYFLDNSPINLQVILRRNSSVVEMASIISAGTPGETSLSDNKIDNPLIDNALYAYTIDINPVGGPWPDVSMIVRRIVFEYAMSSL